MIDDEVVAKLRRKHPQAPPARPALASMGPPSRAVVPDLSAESVVRGGSAPGPSGLRGDHLWEALATAHGDEVAAHLTEAVRILAARNVPTDVAPHLAGARLFALPKSGGDLRPIAVGETLGRLVGKCLCAAVKEDALRHFAPLQLGVATPLGTEAIIHAVRQWLVRNTGSATKVLLKVDFENAFNVLDRPELLRQVRAHLPGLAPWVEWRYGAHSRLLCDGAWASTAGRKACRLATKPR